MATFVDLANATYPGSLHGTDIYPQQGVSLVSAFHGNDLNREQPLFFEHEGNRALQDERPTLLQRMVQTWKSMARRIHAVPWPHGGEFGTEEK